jgi:hypothetical protein
MDGGSSRRHQRRADEQAGGRDEHAGVCMYMSSLNTLWSTVARWWSLVGSRGLELATGCGRGETAIEGRWLLRRPCFQVSYANSPGRDCFDLRQSRARGGSVAGIVDLRNATVVFWPPEFNSGSIRPLEACRRLRPFGCHNCHKTTVLSPTDPLYR